MLVVVAAMVEPTWLGSMSIREVVICLRRGAVSQWVPPFPSLSAGEPCIFFEGLPCHSHSSLSWAFLLVFASIVIVDIGRYLGPLLWSVTVLTNLLR